MNNYKAKGRRKPEQAYHAYRSMNNQNFHVTEIHDYLHV